MQNLDCQKRKEFNALQKIINLAFGKFRTFGKF
jgi:hypothetical protein